MEYIRSNLTTIASDIRYFIVTGLETLPLTIAGTLLILGFFIGNYAMLFFLVGYLLAVPTLAFVINLISPKSFILGGKDSDVCNVITGYTVPGSKRDTNDSIVSYWMAMVSFFIGYVLHNSYSLYAKESPSINPKDPQSGAKVAAGIALRQSQSITAMALIVALAIAILYIRIWSSCDSYVSIALGALFGAGGWFWYTLLAKVGQDRLSDLFGIANRLMTTSAMTNAPYACLPQASS
jgi:hypothetical protein